MKKVHKLKIESQYFNDILNNKKRFEIRKNDRGFKVGDRVHLIEGCSRIEFTIDYISSYMQVNNYVVLGFENYRLSKNKENLI